jgi:hypothetical protein
LNFPSPGAPHGRMTRTLSSGGRTIFRRRSDRDTCQTICVSLIVRLPARNRWGRPAMSLRRKQIRRFLQPASIRARYATESSFTFSFPSDSLDTVLNCCSLFVARIAGSGRIHSGTSPCLNRSNVLYVAHDIGGCARIETACQRAPQDGRKRRGD